LKEDPPAQHYGQGKGLESDQRDDRHHDELAIDERADAVEEKDLAQKLMINMNTAEFQKFKTQLEFERLVLKPIAERTEYDAYNIEQLKDELAHWSGRIREIESR